MKKRLIALFLVVSLCMAAAAAFAEETSEPYVYTLKDGGTITFSEVVRTETAVNEEGTEYTVLYLPAAGFQLTYKVKNQAPGLLMFAYESWANYLNGEDMGAYVLFQPNTEGTVGLALSNEAITWPDNVCFVFYTLADSGWGANDLVFRFETAVDGPNV